MEESNSSRVFQYCENCSLKRTKAASKSDTTRSRSSSPKASEPIPNSCKSDRPRRREYHFFRLGMASFRRVRSAKKPFMLSSTSFFIDKACRPKASRSSLAGVSSGSLMNKRSCPRYSCTATNCTSVSRNCSTYPSST